MQLCRDAPAHLKARLLNPRTAALDQNDQNDNKQDTGNNLNHRGASHLNSPFI
jgi:hypothetical protein